MMGKSNLSYIDYCKGFFFQFHTKNKFVCTWYAMLIFYEIPTASFLSFDNAKRNIRMLQIEQKY